MIQVVVMVGQCHVSVGTPSCPVSCNSSTRCMKFTQRKTKISSESPLNKVQAASGYSFLDMINEKRTYLPACYSTSALFLFAQPRLYLLRLSLSAIPRDEVPPGLCLLCRLENTVLSTCVFKKLHSSFPVDWPFFTNPLG